MSVRKTVRLTALDGGGLGLKMVDGKIEWAEDGVAAAQHSTERLLQFKGELSLNGALTTKTAKGTKYYEIIFNVAKTRAEKNFELRRRILGTPGIAKITSWNWSQDGTAVSIVGTGETDEGGSVELTQMVESL